MENNFFDKINDCPIIAAVNDLQKLDSALKSPCEVIFLLTGNIINLQDIVKKVKANGKEIYIHLDLMEGFSKDSYALRYIDENIRPHGVITTKSSLVKQAKEMKIFTIQRLFILDSLSLETGIKSIRNATLKPDAIEILPGIMPKIFKKFDKETNIPLIAGGLISDKDDVIESLKASAIAVSTSKEEIWYL